MPNRKLNQNAQYMGDSFFFNQNNDMSGNFDPIPLDQNAITQSVNEIFGIQTTQAIDTQATQSTEDSLVVSSFYGGSGNPTYTDRVTEKVVDKNTVPVLSTNTGDPNIDKLNANFNKGMQALEKQKKMYSNLYKAQIISGKQTAVSTMASQQNEAEKQAIADQIVYDSTGIKSPSMIKDDAIKTVSAQYNDNYSKFLTGAVSSTSELYKNIETVTKLQLSATLNVMQTTMNYKMWQKEMQLKWEEFYLQQDQFALEQDKFAWQKEMDQADLDMQQAYLDEQKKQSEWERNFSEEQQSWTEQSDARHMAIQQQAVNEGL